ncbi:MAG: hypothetical protein RL260_1729 [Pseudomonadota bacterium]
MHSQRFPAFTFVLITAAIAAVPASLLWASAHPPTKVAGPDTAPIVIELADGSTLEAAPKRWHLRDTFGRRFVAVRSPQREGGSTWIVECNTVGKLFMPTAEGFEPRIFPAESVGAILWSAVCREPGDRSTDNQPAKVTS